MYTIDKSVTLYECTFSDNTDIGWQAVAMTIPSTITRSYFLNNFQGIDYEATSTSGLLIQGESRVDYNDYMGIEFFSGAKLSIDCSDIKYNGTYYSVAPGILLHHGASLNMSPSQSPICEKNYVVGNYYNIMTEDPANPGSSNNYMNYLYLSGGYNYLVPATGTKVITAKTKAYSCLARSIIANNNKWSSQNSSPVWNVDYLTYNANCSPIRPFNITDNSPGYLECNIGGSGTTSIQGGSAISLFSSSENDDLIIQTTDYPGATLSSATSNSSTYLTAYDGAGDDKVALNRILQILNYIHGNSLNASAMQIHGLLNLANEAVAGLGKPQNASLLQSSNSEINDLLSFYTLYKQDFNSSDSSEYLTWFELSLAKAHIYQTLERYDDALSEINLIMPYVYPDQAAVLNRLYCIISTEKDLIDGLLSVDDFNSSIELCNVNFRNMITTDEPSENGGTETNIKSFLYSQIQPINLFRLYYLKKNNIKFR